VGYLPDAIINYLVLLGWSQDDKTEFFTRDEMIAGFSLDRVNLAPASFDPKKLWSFQDHYMQEVPLKQKVAMVLPYLQRAGLVATPPPCDVGPVLTRIVDAAGDRIKTAGDVLSYADFFVPDERLEYDEKAFQEKLRDAPEAAAWLRSFKEELATAEPFEPENLERLLKAFIERQAIKIGQFVGPLRIALTGKAVGFGLFDTLAILGRQRSLARIDQALARV
jgi:glutamyl-tRNA synthetase